MYETYSTNTPAQKEDKPLLVVGMDAVPIKQVEWLWYPYIPFGKVTILQGDPGCGKTMVALDLAAKLSRGECLPFCKEATPPITVLYQTAEDGVDDTIKPRLVAARADCTKIKFVEESKNPLSFTDKRIESAIRSVNAKLLILDPLSAYIGSNVNLNQAIGVRASFRPLYEVADRTGCAILVISHMNKLQGAASLYRTNGSIDVAGAVRSILSVGKKRHEKDRRIMVHIKSNLAAAGPAMIYQLSDHIEWLEQADIDPEELFSAFGSERDTKRDRAENELIRLLSKKDIPATQIEKHFQQLGISYRTVTDAKKALGIQSYRLRNQSVWTLPELLRNKEDCIEGSTYEL